MSPDCSDAPGKSFCDGGFQQQVTAQWIAAPGEPLGKKAAGSQAEEERGDHRADRCARGAHAQTEQPDPYDLIDERGHSGEDEEQAGDWQGEANRYGPCGRGAGSRTG